MNDIGKLIERVEAGTIAANGHQEPFAACLLNPLNGDISLFAMAYGGSVDAALALKAELLGDRWVSALQENNEWWATMSIDVFASNPNRAVPTNINVVHKSPARALLLATLKAYQWEKEQ